MDGGGDGATPSPTSATSVEAAWDLTQAEDDNPESWARKRDAILADLQAKLKNLTPLKLLEKKYPSAHDKDRYARLLWHQFPPMASNPPLMRADLPGKQEELLTAEDVIVMHLATISFSATSMVCEPTIDKIMKLVDEILTDGFVTDTEPLILNVTPMRWSSRAWKAFRRGVRWLMGLHLSAHSVCATTSPRHA